MVTLSAVAPGTLNDYIFLTVEHCGGLIAMIQLWRYRTCLSLLLFLAASYSNLNDAAAADAPVPFEGEKSSWHDGFDRYDYLMDETDLDIQPFKRDENENFGIKDPPTGKAALRRHRSQATGRRQPLVVARLLLGPPAAGRGRTAPARLSRRLHLRPTPP